VAELILRPCEGSEERVKAVSAEADAARAAAFLHADYAAKKR
jgi:hypothetical protein